MPYIRDCFSCLNNVSVKFPIRIVGMCAVLKVSKTGVTFNCHQIIMATLIVILPQKVLVTQIRCMRYIFFICAWNEWLAEWQLNAGAGEEFLSLKQDLSIWWPNAAADGDCAGGWWVRQMRSTGCALNSSVVGSSSCQLHIVSLGYDNNAFNIKKRHNVTTNASSPAHPRPILNKYEYLFDWQDNQASNFDRRRRL